MPSTTCVIDPARVRDIAQAGGYSQGELLSEFVRLNAADAALLRASVAANNLGETALLAHRLDGASRMLGAALLAEACERVGAASSGSNRGAMRAAMAGFETCLAQVEAHIGSLAPSP